MDFTAPQMILTVKLISLAFNYRDGNVPEKDLREEWKPYAIKRLPNLLEFYSWVFFFGGFLAGPYCELKTFLQCADLSLYQGQVPNTIFPALRKIGHAVFCFVFLFAGIRFFPPAHLKSKEFYESTILHNTLYVTLSMMLGLRCQYYFAWKLAEGAAISAGLGYMGLDKAGNPRWDGVDNVDVIKIETAQSPRDLSLFWNKTVGRWLRNYIYTRWDPIHKPPSQFAMYLTNLTSALWHGYYPGYYVTFIYASVAVDVSRKWRRYIRPYFVKVEAGPDGKDIEVPIQPRKTIYDLAGIVYIQIAFSYCQGTFYLLDIWLNWKFLVAVGFSCHILLIGLMTIFFLYETFFFGKEEECLGAQS